MNLIESHSEEKRPTYHVDELDLLRRVVTDNDRVLTNEHSRSDTSQTKSNWVHSRLIGIRGVSS